MSVASRRATRPVSPTSKRASCAFPRARALLPACCAMGAALGACKPGGPGSPSASNVFSLEPGEYAFVRGSVREKSSRNDQSVAATGGTGKIVTVESRGRGRLALTDTGKYAWRVGAEAEVNVDCTAAQDVLAFDVYTVVGGTGRLGNLDVKRGCRLQPEPSTRPDWTPVSLTPRGQGAFVLLSEATHRGRALVLEETYRAKRAE